MTFARQMARPEFKLCDEIARRCMSVAIPRIWEQKTETSPDLSVLHKQETEKLHTYHSDLSGRVFQGRRSLQQMSAQVELQEYRNV